MTDNINLSDIISKIKGSEKVIELYISKCDVSLEANDNDLNHPQLIIKYIHTKNSFSVNLKFEEMTGKKFDKLRKNLKRADEKTVEVYDIKIDDISFRKKDNTCSIYNNVFVHEIDESIMNTVISILLKHLTESFSK